MNITLAIATVLIAAALTGILSTNPIAFAQDESETSTEQEIKQKNVCSGWAVCTNIAENRENSATGTNAP
jgi:archaellum component FlaG (FlaF/FlaG flagellin family)